MKNYGKITKKKEDKVNLQKSGLDSGVGYVWERY